ncbi:unnamed protein product [Leptidea sinapis]|uniref:Uncharacterized protein n=1 Tax=Leptidea sinapis TaxID=189913 RepID=A0A5E4PPL4_9NEOP|nr:unnamed protein product [Leptidea sinapis]
MSSEEGDDNIAFVARFTLNELDESYIPTKISEVVKLWRDSLKMLGYQYHADLSNLPENSKETNIERNLVKEMADFEARGLYNREIKNVSRKAESAEEEAEEIEDLEASIEVENTRKDSIDTMDEIEREIEDITLDDAQYLMDSSEEIALLENI